MFNELWPGFDSGRGADRLDHQRCARADLGGAAVARARPRAVRRRTCQCAAVASPTSWERLQQVDPGHLWWIRSQLREAARRRRPRAAAPVLAGARCVGCRIGLDRNGFRSGRADGRVRPPGADLQAADADAARSGAAGEAAARREAADPADRGGQVAPRRRRRQGADPAGGAVRRPARGAAPHRVPARLRHVDGPASCTGAATCG